MSRFTCAAGTRDWKRQHVERQKDKSGTSVWPGGYAKEGRLLECRLYIFVFYFRLFAETSYFGPLYLRKSGTLRLSPGKLIPFDLSCSSRSVYLVIFGGRIFARSILNELVIFIISFIEHLVSVKKKKKCRFSSKENFYNPFSSSFVDKIERMIFEIELKISEKK